MNRRQVLRNKKQCLFLGLFLGLQCSGMIPKSNNCVFYGKPI